MLTQSQGGKNPRARRGVLVAIPGCDFDYLIMLQRVINTEIRYIYGVRRDEYITHYRRQLGWTTHVDRRLYFAAIRHS